MFRVLFYCFLIVFSCIKDRIFAAPQCFIVSDLESGKILFQEGMCSKRVSSCSTFKIPLSLMGFDAGILKDTSTPEWPFQEDYKTWNFVWTDKWATSHNPTKWMQTSCIWYSQLLTPQLGKDRLESYLSAFDYGNCDFSGDEGQDNGLSQAWLSSSLKISPLEQITFLRKLLKQELPVSSHAHQMTKDILFLEDLPTGGRLYGRTGSWIEKGNKESHLKDRPGWFVGWVEKQGQTFVFVYLIQDDGDEQGPAGLRAKAQAKEKLVPFLK